MWNTLLTKRFETPGSPKFRLWFGKEDGILRQQILYDEKGKEWIRWIVKAVDTRTRIDDSLFTFTPPEGLIVTDDTRAMEQLLSTPEK